MTVSLRIRLMLWRYRWNAWKSGVPVIELMRIAKTYRLMMRRWKAEKESGES